MALVIIYFQSNHGACIGLNEQVDLSWCSLINGRTPEYVSDWIKCTLCRCKWINLRKGKCNFYDVLRRIVWELFHFGHFGVFGDAGSRLDLEKLHIEDEGCIWWNSVSLSRLIRILMVSKECNSVVKWYNSSDLFERFDSCLPLV